MENKLLPANVMAELERRILETGNFGSVFLKILLHDGKPRYVISSETSIIPGRETSGGIYAS